MNKLFFFLILVIFVFFQSCDTATSTSICNPTCNDWEYCGSIEDDYGDSIATCLPEKGRCESQKDCAYPQKCDTRTNWCLGNCTPKCESWEKCSINDKCEALENYCNTYNDCNDEKPICDSRTHQCTYNCQDRCEDWQICTEDKICEADQTRYFCDENNDCQDGKTCNTETHKCVYDNCNPKCEGWQTCDRDGQCITSEGRCDPKEGCERNTSVSFTCDAQSHTCKKDPGVCTPICALWQTCDGNNECVTDENHCNENGDCNNGYKCSVEHICKPIDDSLACNEDNDCEDWQYCEDGRCKLKQGSCNLLEDCLGDSVCDFASHTCETVCETPCEYWEECSTDGTSCVFVDDGDFCLSDLNCKNGNKCNLASHKCENFCVINCEPWGTCEENGECSVNDGYCDEGDDCGTTFGYSATCDLTTHTCEGDPSNACDPFCESWEVCNASNSCELANDRCKNNSDCANNEYCSLNTHTCKVEPSNGCNPECGELEFCGTGNICKKIEGVCTNNSDCSGTDVCLNNECQDPDPSGCTPSCNPWEVCTEEACKVREDRCSTTNDCENNQICNTTSHLCVYNNCNPTCNEWETCTSNGTCLNNENRCSENSDCSTGLFCNAQTHTCGDIEYCDGNEDCGTTFGYSATCDLTTHTCEEDPSSDCDPFCQPWEICNLNNVCELANDRCLRNNDCGEGKYCSRVSHTCEVEPSNGCDPECNYWEYCAEGDVCTQIEGTCTSVSDCSGGQICKDKECQDPDPSGCTPLCDPWEICSNNTCQIREDRCLTTTDCENNQVCNPISHLCESNTCIITCQDWETCDEANCVIGDGRCNDGGDCPQNKYCEVENHTCTDNPGNIVCNPRCEDWERCLDDQCKLNEGFCTINSDCSENERCSENHLCVNEQPNGCSDDSDCQEWQFCSSSKQCIHKEDFCDSTANCEGVETCSTTTHTCEVICSPVCEYWQTCGSNGECVNEENNCSGDSDCIEGEEQCNDTHTCEKTCNPDCQPHQYCDDGVCKVSEGLCDTNSDCSDGEFCVANHTCELECTPSCNEWETCVQFINSEERECILSSGRCSEDAQSENYGCTNLEENIDISCDLNSHTCIENEGVCDPNCEPWEVCTLDNICKPAITKCNLNQDCYDGLICDIETHDCVSDGITEVCISDENCSDWKHCNPEGVCVLDINACDDITDCEDGRVCNTEIHSCVRNPDECLVACESWQECVGGLCIAKESELNCNMLDYCGEYSNCSSVTHKCENYSNSCGSCNPWEVCLESGCSLIYGTCNQDKDCSYNKICNSTTHVCTYKTCTSNNDCVTNDMSASSFCHIKNGESVGYCESNNNDAVREVHGYNKTNIENSGYEDYVFGTVISIYKDDANKQIGFYLYEEPSKEDGIYRRDCNCETINGTSICQQNSIDNIKDCPFRNFLFRGIYLLVHKDDYENFKNKQVGDKVVARAQHINFYGKSIAFALKGFISNLNAPCTPETEEYVCDEDQQCIDNACRKPFLDLYVYNIKVSDILRGNLNKAEAFESSLVNAVDNKPYTVIENASASNNYRTKLKDSYDEEFYIDKELSNSYSLYKGTGQCINNACHKESWTSCNKYCENGFKLIQEDTNKDNIGDTCQDTDDLDGDGVSNSLDNCASVFNPRQDDMDNDNKGDACDDDLDGDGWVNGDDNCPTVVNVDQEYTALCSESISIPANASFDDGDALGDITRNSNGTWNAISGCEWSCNTGYSGAQCDQCSVGFHYAGSQCVIDETCEDDTCPDANKGVCNVVGGIAVCSCDSGYHAVSNSCIIDEVCTTNSCTETHKSVCSIVLGVTQCSCDSGYHLDNSDNCVANSTIKAFTQILPPPRTGKWGNACNYTNDKDWDGVLDSEDNCPSTFNPTQGDYDEDGIGDMCDPDIDGDGFLNNEDNCMYHYNPILCKICECAPTNEYQCQSDSNCSNIMVRGHDSGQGTCHYYETTLRTLKGVLKYEHESPASRRACNSNSDCTNGETCKKLESNFVSQEYAGGICSSGTKSDDASYIIMPRNSSDMSLCNNQDCTY